MKETFGSLKAYFIIVAVFGLIGSLAILSEKSTNLLIIIIGLIRLGFSGAYLYMGIALRKLIIESPKLISNVILASMVYQIIYFLLMLVNIFLAGSDLQQSFQRGLLTGLVVQLVIGLWITWYLLNNVQRLSQEEKSKATPE
jgi:hypothetical protein